MDKYILIAEIYKQKYLHLIFILNVIVILIFIFIFIFYSTPIFMLS